MNSITTNQGLTLEVGKRYIIDTESSNSGEIELVAIYGKLFCRVKYPEGYNVEKTFIDFINHKDNFNC